MEILNELVKFLSKNKTKNIQVLGQTHQIDSTTKKLYDILTQGDPVTDRELNSAIYGKINDNSSSLRKLKSRLNNRLLNTILIIDPEVKNLQIIDRAFLKANKLFSVGNILFVNDAINGAKLCYIQVLELSETYEFTELKLFASSRLRQIAGDISQDRKDFIKYNAIYKQANREFEAERFVQENYSNLISLISKSRKVVFPLTSNELSEIKNKLNKYKEWCRTYTFERVYFLFMVLTHFLTKKYNEVIKLSDSAIEHFKRRNYSLRKTLLMFQGTKIMALLESGQYEQGIELSNSIKNEHSYGEYNWYSNIYYLFLLLVYSREYTRAAEELSEMISGLKNKKLPSHLTENINILTAYIYFLNIIGKIRTTKLHNSILNFKINRFLNDIPLFSKDKRGLNISILILHVLIMLANQEYNKIIDRVDALNQYSSRYLRKDATFRSNIMVKMLLAMINADFHPVRTKRYTDELFKKLQTVPRGVTEQGAEVEIVPYEDLWPMVLELLQKK